jgi:hypothetical protein
MDKVMIRYRVTADRLDQHLALLRAAYDELHASAPENLRWVTYQLDDSLSFLDIVSGSGDPADLAARPAFHRFRSTLDDRCDEPPTMNGITEIGRYSSPQDRRSVT